MEINIENDKRTVDIWLTNAERKDSEIHESLKAIYGKYKNLKYTVVVFESGERDLYRDTLDLLVYNKRRCAELEVQHEKKRSAAVT